jgi:DUF4097 and DUF4098 domain-containing protein YvlB
MKPCATIWLAAGLLAAALAAPTPSAARQVNKDYHETFKVAEGHRLLLVHGDGDVTITPWDRDEVDVVVHYRANVTKIGPGKVGDFEVEFSQEGKTLRVIGKEGDSFAVGFLSRHEYEYTYKIQAPSYLQLELRGDDGDVSIRDWRAPISCDLDDGDVDINGVQAPKTKVSLEDGNLQIAGLEGDLVVEGEDGAVDLRDCRFGLCRVEGEDGEVRIEDCEGSFELETEDGDQDAQRVLAHRFETRTEDGDIELDLRRSDDLDLEVETGDGDVTVGLAPGFSLRFDVETDGGSIRVHLPSATFGENEDDHVTGQQQGGQGRLRIRTDDGDVRLRETG